MRDYKISLSGRINAALIVSVLVIKVALYLSGMLVEWSEVLIIQLTDK